MSPICMGRQNLINNRAGKPIPMRGACLCLGALFLALTGGCAVGPSISFHAERYRVEVRLDPDAHTLVGRAVLDLVAPPDRKMTGLAPVSVQLLLHPSLKITNVAAGGVTARYLRSSVDPPDPDDGYAPRRHVISLDRSVEKFTLFIDYAGKLRQNVSTGEIAGEIHNRTMRAHIAAEGVYLANGCWYPKPVNNADPNNKPSLSEFLLIAHPIPNFELVASAERDEVATKQTGRPTWRSPYPIEELTLVGGPHEVHEALHGDTKIRVHLKPSQSKHAAGLIQTVRRNLDRYEPLIGPYPAREFSIVDNFFSSGFAFPTFTLLSSAVIDMGKRSQTAHGYIDHELLHSWWGNGVAVDPNDGNWCESLASYGANYYGFVLDGDDTQARRKRRNYSHFLSRIEPERDKPLGTFGEKDGCSRSIAYQKGAAVFHMLARTIGQDNFWAAMRRLTREYVGAYASWSDILRLCEEVGDRSLTRFEEQWIRSGGAPTLALENATYDSRALRLTFDLTQGETSFELNVPIRVVHDGGVLDTHVSLDTPFNRFTVPINVVPQTVEVDPDYHIFRKVSPSDIIPTTSSTRFGSAFVTVIPAEEMAASYEDIRAIFEKSFTAEERTVRLAGDIETGALAERCALILGAAVRDSYVGAFLDAVEFPVRFTKRCFVFDGVTYADPGDAVLCTVTHPGVAGGGVTVVFANSEAAIPIPMFLPMYDRSLVIFKDRRPILRRDFERRHIVSVR